MSEELKPCPFCGKTSVHVSESFCGGWFAKCRECGAEIGSPHSEDDAKENWNRRAQQPNEPLMVTFPCKMGDTVYKVEDGLPIISYRVTGFVLGKTEFEDEDDIEARLGWQVEYGKYGVDCECPISEFGKSLFLTHEAAEQALAYRRPLEAGEKE